MMKLLIATLIFTGFAAVPYAGAQSADLDSDVDVELDQITSTDLDLGPQGNLGQPTGAAIAPSGTVSGQPIYILNQATPTSNAQVQSGQVQKQPQVDITASPLQKSRADRIREARQQVEVETENKIVEKLETSRIEDEKRRANVLFGQQFDQLGSSQQVAPPVQQQLVPQVQVVPVQVLPVPAPAPAPTAAVVKEDDFIDGIESRADNRSWIRQEIQAALKAEEKLPLDPIETRYFGATVGVGDYPDVRNVRGNYLLGASFGTKFDNSYAVEGSFVYGDYTVEQLGGGYYDPQFGYWIPRLIDVQQYSGALSMKFMLFEGIVKPVFGGLIQYSYRNYRWSQDWYGLGGNLGGNQDAATSHAVDLGLIAGADIDFSRKFSIGLDFKYMYNLSSRIDAARGAAFLTSPSFGTPLERLQYYTMSLTGKVNF